MLLRGAITDTHPHTHSGFNLHLLTRDSISKGGEEERENSPLFWYTSHSRLPSATDPLTLILLHLPAGLISSSGSHLHALITFQTDQWGGRRDEVGARWNTSKGPFKTHQRVPSLSEAHRHQRCEFVALARKIDNDQAVP